MSSRAEHLPEVFSLGEIARASGAPPADVRAFAAAAAVPGASAGYVPFGPAVELVRALTRQAQVPAAERTLFAPASTPERSTTTPLAASGVLHGAVVAGMVLLSSLGARGVPASSPRPEPVRLVYLASPGPGGGGGGGGSEERRPAVRARRPGPSTLSSPVTLTDRREPAPEPPPIRSIPVEPEPAVEAPVASLPADRDERAGLVQQAPEEGESRGSGEGEGAGTGLGSGDGAGQGDGIGQGRTAGTGGGPFRPGSGIAPPTLLREVKPQYSEEGRRRGVEGDVIMEAVVRVDGTVGDVRVLRGLGAGLDSRAVDAVRQWQFQPARRFGTPVDVLVEVAVEFRLR